MPEGSRGAHGKGIDTDFLNERTLTAVQKLRPIADDLGLSMANLALAWVLHNQGVSAAIVGATRPEQVAENVKASGVKLDHDVLRRVDEALGDVVQKDPGLTG
jgi:aryl-alcohol dehydrogenase-like predicted oxidoreductase